VSDWLPLRVLLIHNYYQQTGGEDQVFAAEASLLETNGDEVIRYTDHNDRINEMAGWSVAKASIWNKNAYTAVKTIIRATRPHVLHAHNTFPLISPAVYAAAKDEGIPVVQTLHNFRLLCANSLLFRGGKICEDCVGTRTMWPAVAHRCYRGSLAASAAVVGMTQFHRIRGTWRHLIDVYITLTEFARGKFVEVGLPAEKLLVMPNFVDSPFLDARGDPGAYMVFVGRLAAEKGVRTLLAAWAASPDLPPLVFVGHGPLASEVEQAVARDGRIRWLGFQPTACVQTIIRNARALLFPTQLYEGCPLVVLEAYAASVPVIASAVGSAMSLIDDGRTGLHHIPGDAQDLAAKVHWAWRHPTAMLAMGASGRVRYEEHHTGPIHYHLLRQAYARALGTSPGSCQAAPLRPVEGV
jgi:glycosyltransferase involved in cell wall biosynthesis